MVSVTKKQLDLLISLQKIETRSVRIGRVMGGVSGRVESIKAELAAFEKSAGEKISALEEMRQKYRDLESEVHDNGERLKKSREYLKVVKTNKEYQVLLREIDDNEKRNSILESSMFEFLEKIEAEEENSESQAAELEQFRETKQQEISSIESETEKERKELEEIDAERIALSEKIAPNVLDLFNRTLKTSGGLALVLAFNGACGGCFMNIPHQLFIEVQKGDLKFCPQCHRMLYWQDKEA